MWCWTDGNMKFKVFRSAQAGLANLNMGLVPSTAFLQVCLGVPSG
jgi:hypothetical protein